MKQKEKLFILKGSKTKHLTLYNQSSILATKNLQEFADIIELGDPSLGFNHNELSNLFKGHIDDEDQQLNIILYTHGTVKDSTYYISTSGTKTDPELVNKQIDSLTRNNNANTKSLTLFKTMISSQSESTSAEIVIKELVKIAGNRPLKIFAVSCYGENLLDFVDLLTPGSFIITLSDKNSSTKAADLRNNKYESILSSLFNNTFKMEYLLEAFLASQTYQQNTPKIGIKNINGESLTINIAEYVEKLPLPLDQIKFSSIFSDLLANNNIKEKDILDTLSTIQQEHNINSYKLTNDDYKKVIDFRNPFGNSSNEKIKKLITKHYPPISDTEIEEIISNTQKDLFGLDNVLEELSKGNLTLFAALEMPAGVDFEGTNAKSYCQNNMPLYNILMAAGSDIMHNEYTIEQYVMGEITPDSDL